VSQDAPVTKVWRKSVNRYWRYRGNIKLPHESRTHGQRHRRTTRKHIASTGTYRRRRLKNTIMQKDAVNVKLTLRFNFLSHKYLCATTLDTNRTASLGPNRVTNQVQTRHIQKHYIPVAHHTLQTSYSFTQPQSSRVHLPLSCFLFHVITYHLVQGLFASLPLMF